MTKRAWKSVVLASVVLTLGLVASASEAQEPASPPAAPAPAPPPAFPPGSTPTPVLAPPPPVPEAATPPAAASSAPAAATTGCVKDVECKGDRICVAGQCVSPTPAAPVQSATSESNPSAAPTRVVIYTPPADEKVSSTGLTFGVRFGVGFPGGAAVASVTDSMGGSSNGALSGVVGVLLPVTVDVGYRLSPHWYVGSYVSVAYGTSSSEACSAGGTGAATCYETDIRFGLDVRYNFLPDKTWQPWIGVGAGWEVLNQILTDDSGDDFSSSLNGLEFAHVDLGVDYRINDRAKIGPYFLASFANFDNPETGDPGKFIHEWYTVGARLQYDTNAWHRRDRP